MSGLPILETYIAAAARLKGDLFIAEKVKGRVFTHAPQGTAFPYITISGATASDASDKSDNGADITMQFHVWSRQQGEEEVLRIIQGIHAQLHNQTINLPAPHQAIVCQWDGLGEIFTDPDGQTHHGVTSFAILTSSTNAAA